MAFSHPTPPPHPSAPPMAAPPQNVQTKEFAVGDYAPMRSSMPSLARAVSGVSSPDAETSTRSQKYSFFRNTSR